MATYFVSSSGSNTSPYDTWAKAATSLQTALTAASSNGDIVVIKYDGVPSGDSAVSANTTWTISADIALISASADDAGTAYTPTAMGSSYWIGTSSASYSLYFAGASKALYMYGVTMRNGGTASCVIVPAFSGRMSLIAESCYFWTGTTNANSVVYAAYSSGSHATLRDCTLRFGHASHRLSGFSGGGIDMIGGRVSSDGTAPSGLIAYSSTAAVSLHGVDLSYLTNTIIPDHIGDVQVTMSQCKLGAGVTILAAQTSAPTAGSPCVYVFDCHSGDTHLMVGYYDALGSVVSNTGTYLTAGAAGQSWEINTTANPWFLEPFCTPWIDLYHDGTSGITPYLEVLRNNGTATKYNDDEVWAEVSAKVTAGTVLPTFYTDRRGLVASAAAQADGAGTGSWTIGSSNSPASFKIDSGASLTPAETGHVRFRICVGKASVSGLYVDPQIRT